MAVAGLSLVRKLEGDVESKGVEEGGGEEKEEEGREEEAKEEHGVGVVGRVLESINMASSRPTCIVITNPNRVPDISG
ncbi:hypothetical protein HMI55_005880 [Coelomomyces lativittatus]|nr:hypothetical protein HMI55_005880 [Coelomomyces lativittatus]